MVARLLCLLLTLSCGLAAWADDALDPLRSPLWSGMKARFFDPGARVVFDQRVQVRMPAAAEDSLNVPVEVAVEGIAPVARVLLFADLNPIPKILEFEPLSVRPWLAFRFKVEQATPVRAAVLDGDGVWHVGGAWISAAGGGCTMPSVGTGNPVWQERIGEVAARLWPRNEGGSRLRFRVIHPMDTGLAAGIPVFHLDDLAVLDDVGTPLAKLTLFEPVSENPVISLELPVAGPVRLQGRDTQGNAVSAQVMP